MELIKHAAVKAIDGQIFIGKQHADCFHKAHNIKYKMSKKAEDQGFMTSEGRYVGRAEAHEIALNAGQIDCGLSGYILFSEDLWSKEFNGKFNYCEIKGYIPREGNIKLSVELKDK